MGENRNFHFRKGWIPLFIPKLTTSVVEIDFIFTYLVECVDKMEDAFYGDCFPFIELFRLHRSFAYVKHLYLKVVAIAWWNLKPI